MKKHIVAGMTTFALMLGGALSQQAVAQQDTQSATTTTRTYNADGSVKVKKDSHAVDANGVQTQQSHTYSADDTGSESKSVTETTAPDGTSVRTKKQRVTTPDGESTTHETTSTEKW